jgi:hypothetical protein
MFTFLVGLKKSVGAAGAKVLATDLKEKNIQECLETRMSFIFGFFKGKRISV